MKILDLLRWRYAVKKYAKQQVAHEKIDYIINAINLAATSTGIQPYRVVMVKEQQLLDKLLAPQMSNASCILVFAANEDIGYDEIEDYITRISKVRDQPQDTLDDFKLANIEFILNRTVQEKFNWCAKQAYIGLGTALLAAAEQYVDSTPMEGFDNKLFDEVLKLKEIGLKSVVNLVLGYRADDDKFAFYKKVRLPLNRFVIER